MVFERENTQVHLQEAQEQKFARRSEQIGRLTTQVNWLEKSGLEPDA